MPKLLVANWRELPKISAAMSNVALMILDILPQAKNAEDFGLRTNDIPPFKIPYLIDDFSSMILDFEVAESPAQVTHQVPVRAYIGMAERYQSEF